MVPLSALKGWNVVDTDNHGQSDWCGYTGPSLLSILEALPVTPAETDAAFSFPVQWVEKFHDSGITTQGRRVFWGRVATGSIAPGQTFQVFPSGQTAVVSQATAPVSCWTARWTSHVATGCWPKKRRFLGPPKASAS
jgi:sulfate adenylyltransferase subunit 1